MRLAPAVLLAACSGATPTVGAVAPALVCAGVRVTVTGSEFRPLAGPEPTLSLPQGFLLPAQGEPIALEGAHWDSQSQMSFAVPAGTRPGAYGVAVRNPDGSEGSLAAALALIAPPVVDELTRACGGAPDVEVRGAGFVFVGGRGPTVLLGGASYAARDPAACAPLPAPAQGMICSRFHLSVPEGVSGGIATIENPAVGGCAAETVVAAVSTGPAVSRLDACGGTLRLRGAGFEAGAVVTLAGARVGATYVDDTTLILDAPAPAGPVAVEVANPDGCHASGTVAVGHAAVLGVVPPVLPAGRAVTATVTMTGLDPDAVSVGGAAIPVQRIPGRPSLYQVAIPAQAAGLVAVVAEEPGCNAQLVVPVAAPTLALARVAPRWLRTGRFVAVALWGDGLAGAPTVALTRTGAGGALRASLGFSAAIATGIVPPVPAGGYDVVAVSSDGRVGYLPDAVRVGPAAPAIDAVSPGAFAGVSTGPLLVRGSGFTSASRVTLRCPDPTPPLAVTSLTADALRATLPGGIVDPTCVVRVTNGDPSDPEAPYAESGTLEVRGDKLDPFETGLPGLVAAREAPAMVAGRATGAARFLYVLGGDAGSASLALASVEAAPLGPDGEVGAFAPLRSSLLVPRTLHGAVRVGRDIYVVGGANAGGTIAGVERARVLDPLEAPDFMDVSVGNGVLAGTHAWMVSARGGPDGESLPSDPWTLTATGSITLTWAPMPGATSYRVYRDGRLVVETPDPRATDDGLVARAEVPLAVGALGPFRAAGQLALPRQAAGVALAHAPDGMPYIYVGGGAASDWATVYDGFEAAPVGPDGPGAFAAAGSIGTARALLPAFVVDDSVDPSVQGSYVYFGAGATAAPGPSVPSNRVNETTAGAVGAGGALAPAQVKTTQMAGAAGVASAGCLHSMGGFPLVGSRGDDGCLGPAPPDLVAWHGAGNGAISDGRALMGAAVERGWIYVAGGTTSLALQPTTIVERTRW